MAVITSFYNCASTICSGTGDDRRIIRALDGYRDGLIIKSTKIIGDTDCIGLGDKITFRERLGCSLAVVEAVGPNTGAGVDGNGAVCG